MLKRFLSNTLFSFLSLLLMSVLFTATGFFLIELTKSFAGVLLIIDFCIILLSGYIIGQRLHYSKSLCFISVVLLPIVVLVALYGLSMVGIPFVSMMIQYPSAVWSEAFGLSADFMNEHNVIRYYAVLIVHYFISALSLFIGALKKGRE